MKVLVTGGAGFIGSTVASAMLDRGITPVILDNLATGRRSFTAGRIFYEGDVADHSLLDRVFAEHPEIAATVHCAALIVVPESVQMPLRYYGENVAKSVSLLGHLVRNGCGRVLFSSSASIYQPGTDLSVDEDSPVAPTSPYAQTKAMIEQILEATAATGELRALSLRYFNPIGADPALRTGLQIQNPSHALGKMIQAWESGEPFTITGVEWPTCDGTGLRDYIHVWDLAQAHANAVERFDQVMAGSGRAGYQAVNLGTGRGTTVRELVDAFSRVVGKPLPTVEAPPRPGDTIGAYTRSDRSSELLGWRPMHSIEDGIGHALAWRALDSSSMATVVR